MKLANWIEEDEAHKPAPAHNYIFTRQSNPARTEVSDASGWLATFTDGARTVSLAGPQRILTEISNPSYDSFVRTRTGTGWGNATFGGKWTEVGGDEPADYSVNGSEGIINVTSAGASRRVRLGTTVQDADVKARFKTNKRPAGDSLAGGLILNYVDSNNHYLARVKLTSNDIGDTFSRTAASSWGASDTGESWSIAGGSTSDFSVGSGVATHSIGSVNVSRRSRFLNSSLDTDVTFRVSTSALAAGASITAGLMARYVDSSNFYLFRLRFTTTQTLQACIQASVAGTLSTLGTEIAVTGLTHVANTLYRVRARTSGSTLQMKVWEDGAAEPSSWTLTQTDTTFAAAGATGLRSIALTGNTNTLPFAVNYDDFSLTDLAGDTVALAIQKQVASVITTIGSEISLPFTHTGSTYLWVRCRMAGSSISAKVWEDGSSEPADWAVTVTDSTFTTGRVGVRAIAFSGATNLPVVFSFADFSCDATEVTRPEILSTTWVRVLPTAFSGTVDTAWLDAALEDTTPDVLAASLQYLPNAPAIYNGSLQIAGDADYGPQDAAGLRIEGSDFNDYLGVPWIYGGTTDNPEGSQFRSLDCSGLVRMVYGYRFGLPMSQSTLDGVSIPRISYDIAASGPGVLLIPDTGAQVTDFSKLIPGDIVSFDADSGDATSGQIDHLGIYLGIDTDGYYRFISSRKTMNGPQLNDISGNSRLDGTGLYATTFRTARRF